MDVDMFYYDWVTVSMFRCGWWMMCWQNCEVQTRLRNKRRMTYAEDRVETRL
jgi:hypothetical protein